MATPDLDAAVALAKQRWLNLLAIRPMDALISGDKGGEAQSRRATGLLRSLYGFIQEFQSVSSQMQDKETPFISLTPSHAEFLRSTLLPNFKNIERAYLYDSEFGDLIGEERDSESRRGNLIEKSLLSIAEYANMRLVEDDIRHSSLEIVYKTILDESFQPDNWAANRRSLRPLILGTHESKIPVRIKLRLTETHRAFIYGAWMAAIALCRSVVEFSLIERAPQLGYNTTSLRRGQSERYLALDELISQAVTARPNLEDELRLMQAAGNRTLHPKKKENVIQSPVLRSEALSCIRALTFVVEELYSSQPPNDA